MIDVDFDPRVVVDILNLATLGIFLVLLGAGLFGTVRRLRLYFAANEPIPVLLKRDIVLLTALATIGTEGLILRTLGIIPDGWWRVLYVAQVDVILILAVFYWVKVELQDVDDPGVK